MCGYDPLCGVINENWGSVLAESASFEYGTSIY